MGVVSNPASPPACPRRCTAAAQAFSLGSTPLAPTGFIWSGAGEILSSLKDGADRLPRQFLLEV